MPVFSAVFFKHNLVVAAVFFKAAEAGYPLGAVSDFVCGVCSSGIGPECGGDIVLLLQSFVPGFQVVLIGRVVSGLGLEQFAC